MYTRLGSTIRRPFQTHDQRTAESEIQAMRRRNKLMRANFRQQEQNPFQLDPQLMAELTDRPQFLDQLPIEEDARAAGLKVFASEQDQANQMPFVRMMGRRLGEGGYGVVFKGQMQYKASGEWTDVAIKTIKLRTGPFKTNGMKVSATIREMRYWNAVSGHPNIPFLFDCFRVKDSMWFVIEMLDGDLFDLSCNFPKARFPLLLARVFFRQVVAGVNYMHSRCLAHRDLKLENILVTKVGDDFVCKVCDFGLATIAWTPRNGIDWQDNCCGTPQYIPPEVMWQTLKGKIIDKRFLPMRRQETQVTPKPEPTPEQPPHMRLYRKYLLNVQSGMRAKETPKDPPKFREYDVVETNGLNHDTWALGIMLYIMVAGVYPNLGEEEQGVNQTLTSMMRGHIPKFSFIPQNLREFIRTMLEPDPAKRATIRDIATHDWMYDNPPSRRMRKIEEQNMESARFEPEVGVPGTETGAVPKGRRPVAGPAVVEVHQVYDSLEPPTSDEFAGPRHGTPVRQESGGLLPRRAAFDHVSSISPFKPGSSQGSHGRLQQPSHFMSSLSESGGIVIGGGHVSSPVTSSSPERVKSPEVAKKGRFAVAPARVKTPVPAEQPQVLTTGRFAVAPTRVKTPVAPAPPPPESTKQGRFFVAATRVKTPERKKTPSPDAGKKGRFFVAPAAVVPDVKPADQTIRPGFYMGSSSGSADGTPAHVPTSPSPPVRSKSKSPTGAAAAKFFVSSGSESSGVSRPPPEDSPSPPPLPASSPPPLPSARKSSSSEKPKPKFFISSDSE